jgi:cold shock CspA family protein
MGLGDVCTFAPSKSPDEDLAQRFHGCTDELLAIREQASPSHLERRMGKVRSVNLEKGFAFAESKQKTYFLHSSQLLHRELFPSLSVGAEVAFSPRKASTGPNERAQKVNWLT